MKKIFASMMMLAATSTGFAQQVTAPEPEFINSYCVLTSDSTFDALPKEDGMISKHQNKFGKFAKIAGAVGDLGFAGGMIGASTSGSASGIINGVRVMGTAAGVGQAADAVNTLAGAEGMDIAFAGGKSAYTVKNANNGIRLLIKGEKNEYDPMEYLIRLLHDKVKIAVLSRGYKRKTSGYVLADKDTTMSEIGDEPFQMHSKFDDIYVAVDAKRVRGIEKLQNEEPTKDVDVVLLDDAFQHRYVKPGINILLVDYHRLIIYDKMLPAGRLREPLSGKNRADIVIITKCPKDLKPMEFRVLTKAMDLYPFQKLYFTCINYDTPKGVFEDQQIAKEELKNYHALLVTGIASPKQMEHDLKPMVKSMQSLSFGDHHRFKNKDITRINEAFEQMPEPRLIITTEKDAVRLKETEGLYEIVKKSIYELPIKVSFMLEQEDNFNDKIISYVRKNSRNSILAKRKDDNKSEDSNHTGNRSRTISFRNN